MTRLSSHNAVLFFESLVSPTKLTLAYFQFFQNRTGKSREMT